MFVIEMLFIKSLWQQTIQIKYILVYQAKHAQSLLTTRLSLSTKITNSRHGQTQILKIQLLTQLSVMIHILMVHYSSLLTRSMLFKANLSTHVTEQFLPF